LKLQNYRGDAGQMARRLSTALIINGAARQPGRFQEVVDELALAMLEAAGPGALLHHQPAIVVLHYAVALMDREQRRRLGRFIEILERESA
jgi:hypothetical protein